MSHGRWTVNFAPSAKVIGSPHRPEWQVGRTEMRPHFDIIAECTTEDEARKIARALNAMDDPDFSNGEQEQT